MHWCVGSTRVHAAASGELGREKSSDVFCAGLGPRFRTVPVTPYWVGLDHDSKSNSRSAIRSHESSISTGAALFTRFASLLAETEKLPTNPPQSNAAVRVR